MGRHQTKPWQRGYIPKPGHKPQNPAFTAPEAPEGFERLDRGDWNSYTTSTPFTFGWTITGRAGVKWRVFEETPTFTDGMTFGAAKKRSDLRFESASFEACVMFVRVEISNEEEKPQPNVGFDPGVLFSQRYHGAIQGRAAGRINAGQMLTQMAQADSIMNAFRESYPSFAQMFHDELIHDCRDSAQAGTAIHEALAALDFSELEVYCVDDAEATRNAKS